MPLSKEELESLRNDLERAIERKHDYIEDTVQQVSDAYHETVRDLLDEVDEALRGIDADDTAAVAQVRNEILQSADATELIWERFDERLDGIIEHIDDYYSRMGTNPRIDRAVVETLKGVWPDGGAGSGIAGDLYDLSVHHRRGLANAVTRNVLGGLPRRQMVNELQELTGRTRWQAKQLVHDSSMAFARTVNAKKAEAGGFEYFEYMGDLVADSRPFCRKHLGKVYTREEIAELDNGQTGEGTAFIRGGGYNCLHDWGPVEKDWFDDDEWEELRPN